jgi:hypothetical protein
MCLKVCVQKEMKFFIFCFLSGWKLFRKIDVCYSLKKCESIRSFYIVTKLKLFFTVGKKGLSWSLLYGSWIYDYLCNQCLSPLTLWVRTPLRRYVLDTILCDKVCRWLATGLWFSPGTPVSSTNKKWHSIP